jgi:integrase
LNIVKTIINYKHEKSDYNHAILIAENGKTKTLLSYVNIYLKQATHRSLQSTNRYADNLKRFFDYLLKNIDKGAQESPDFWFAATDSHLREWQGTLVEKRDSKKLLKPSDKTIKDNASLIKDFYVWAKLSDLPTLIKKHSDEWKFDYKKNSKNKLQVGQVVSGSDSNIDIGKKRNNKITKNSDITIMSDFEIKELHSSYSDPVFAVMHMLALATGLREEGLCQFPYIGVLLNEHIRPYSEMDLSSDNSIKTFDYDVTEKGSERILQVNVKAWQAVCDSYLPLYFERRKKFLKYIKTLPKNKRPTKNSVFFLTNKGHPVTPQKISSATCYAKKRIKYFDRVFHDSRDWYATNFMIQNLTKDQVNNNYYNIGVEDALRKQIGHKDIKTTYTYYLKIASLVLAIKDKKFDYCISSDEFWGELSEKSNPDVHSV